MNAVLNILAKPPAAPTLSELIADRIAAKRAEDEAIDTRRAIDAQLADLLADPLKLEGAVSKKEGDYKVTVTYVISRKVNSDALQDAWGSLTPAQKEAFKWGADARAGELKKLPAAELAGLAKFIESKPGSPQVKIDLV